MQVQLEKPISQRIFREKRSRNGKTVFERQRIGFMVAGIDPDTKDLSIGFSLCHKNDRLDFVPKNIDVRDETKMRIDGYGKMYAADRAVRWTRNSEIVTVPTSIKKDVKKFLNRCKKYYKGKELPHWTMFYIS